MTQAAAAVSFLQTTGESLLINTEANLTNQNGIKWAKKFLFTHVDCLAACMHTNYFLVSHRIRICSLTKFVPPCEVRKSNAKPKRAKKRPLVQERRHTHVASWSY